MNQLKGERGVSGNGVLEANYLCLKTKQAKLFLEGRAPLDQLGLGGLGEVGARVDHPPLSGVTSTPPPELLLSLGQRDYNFLSLSLVASRLFPHNATIPCDPLA